MQASVHVIALHAGSKQADATIHSPRQARTGQALTGAESLPEGVWAPGKDHLEEVFGQPDFLTELIER